MKMCGSLRVWKREGKIKMGLAAMLTACSYPNVRAGHGAAEFVSTVISYCTMAVDDPVRDA